MPNQKSLQSAPESSGYVSSDFEAFFAEVNRGVHHSAQTKRSWQLIYYSAYLACYNRLMSTLRADNDPREAVEVTAAVRQELIDFHHLE